jgi:hypothetical protein
MGHRTLIHVKIDKPESKMISGISSLVTKIMVKRDIERISMSQYVLSRLNERPCHNPRTWSGRVADIV